METGLLNYGLHAFVMLFAVVDPIGNIPFFMTMTGQLTPRARRRTAARTALVAWAALSAFAVGGTAVLWTFRITIPAIQIGGGIILLFIAVRLLWGWQSNWRQDSPTVEPGAAPADPSIVPLGIPLTAGPGALSSTIVLTTQARDAGHVAVVLSAIALVSLLTLLAYVSSTLLMRVLGRSVMVMLSTLMGLVLAALAVQFMLDGLRAAMPSLFAAAT